MESGDMNELYYMDDTFADYLEGSESWSWEQNKAFKNSLVMYLDESGDPWERIAAEVQGKNVEDIVHHYEVPEEDVDAIRTTDCPYPSIQRLRWVMVVPMVRRVGTGKCRGLSRKGAEGSPGLRKSTDCFFWDLIDLAKVIGGAYLETM